ncbi:hypothetical protein HPB52_013891 [Rhipicephalus sanguineus]|uniref:Uncharacterized protein n=1 Tax=Rhipicephalus sanguineus TaxID=34632 RepID=A0A9D4QB36_RHISA|nr:hypothetical protein HPB52_013891 [Rhipicephalus sanguineus]
MATKHSVSMVEGMDINPEEAECSGWIEVLSRKKKLSEKANLPDPAPEKGNGYGGLCTAAPSRGVMRRVVKASRIPNLPRDHFKTIVRPRGGLDVRKADLIAFKRALARAASLTTEQACEDTVQQICMGNAITEIAAYAAASDDTCKGVIRGINPDISEAELTDMIVNRRNPGALGVRRIKKTPTVIVLFDGLKVPQYVLCDGVRYPCSLYRRQVDICYACADLRHRADICPKGEDQRRCRGCGILTPPEDHDCDPKCAICEGPHPTGDRQCKKRFQVPFIVRQRRRRRRHALAQESVRTPQSGFMNQERGRKKPRWVLNVVHR